MGAIYGKHNVVEIVRLQKTPYWRISETAEKRSAGNHIVTADFSAVDLGLDYSIDMLVQALNRLSPGRYLFSAFLDPAAKRGGVDTWIEVEPAGHLTGGAIGAVPVERKAYLEGIGEVTLENLSEAFEKKFELMRKKEAEAERVKKIEKENVDLKAQIKEYDTGLNQGILSIGSVVWNVMRSTPAGKEVIGMMNDLKNMNTRQSGTRRPAADQPGDSTIQEAEVVDESVSGTTTDVNQEMENALVKLAKDNPDLVKQLQMMAKLKEDSPELFQDAIDNLITIAG